MKKKKTKKSVVTKVVKKKAVKNKTIVSKRKVKKPIKKTDKELRKIERPFIRYSFIVKSLKVNKNNLVEEIIFEYKGTIVIPKSQKENYNSGSSSVEGVYTIKQNTNNAIFSKDFNFITKQEVVRYLIDNVRSGYILDMRETIKKELMPEYKIITKLPW
jgi:hypothetical protein